MKTNLAYIDDVMDRAIASEAVAPTLPSTDKAHVTKSGRKVIGGFRVHDEAAEKKALDDMIAKRRASIEQFRTDRAALRASLAKLGITPMAVCPVGAWHKVCRDTELFVLSPDGDARVNINRNAFKDYSEKSIDKQVEQSWRDFLKRIFPDFRSPASSSLKATLILPDPPADVQDILCKAQSLKLTVAAVGEAIKLVEKPSELMKSANSHPKDVWAQEQGYEDYADWLKRDPIIFTEQGTAAAIIAQFGDFPIEQAVVDAAVNSDSLLSEVSKPVEEMIAYGDTGSSANTSADVLYQDMIMQQMQQRQALNQHLYQNGLGRQLFGGIR